MNSVDVKTPMQNRYPGDFRRRVMECFKENRSVEEMLDTFSVNLGAFLRDKGSLDDWTPEYVIKVLKDGRQDILLQEAIAAKQISELYDEWSKITRQGVTF